MVLRMGARELEVGGKYLAAMLREANDILDEPVALRERMAADGYLLIRGGVAFSYVVDVIWFPGAGHGFHSW